MLAAPERVRITGTQGATLLVEPLPRLQGGSGEGG